MSAVAVVSVTCPVHKTRVARPVGVCDSCITEAQLAIARIEDDGDRCREVGLAREWAAQIRSQYTHRLRRV